MKSERRKTETGFTLSRGTSPLEMGVGYTVSREADGWSFSVYVPNITEIVPEDHPELSQAEDIGTASKRRRAGGTLSMIAWAPLFNPPWLAKHVAFIPGKMRPAIAMRFKLNTSAKGALSVDSFLVEETCFCSDAHNTYEEVDTALAEGSNPKHDLWAERVELAWALLAQRRLANAVAIFSPKRGLVMLSDGSIDRMPSAVWASYVIGQELSLWANSALASYLQAQKVPALYLTQRLHRRIAIDRVNRLLDEIIREWRFLNDFSPWAQIRGLFEVVYWTATPAEHVAAGRTPFTRVTAQFISFGDVVNGENLVAHLRGLELPYDLPTLEELTGELNYQPERVTSANSDTLPQSDAWRDIRKELSSRLRLLVEHDQAPEEADLKLIKAVPQMIGHDVLMEFAQLLLHQPRTGHELWPKLREECRLTLQWISNDARHDLLSCVAEITGSGTPSCRTERLDTLGTGEESLWIARATLYYGERAISRAATSSIENRAMMSALYAVILTVAGFPGNRHTQAATHRNPTCMGDVWSRLERISVERGLVAHFTSGTGDDGRPVRGEAFFDQTGKRTDPVEAYGATEDAVRQYLAVKLMLQLAGTETPGGDYRPSYIWRGEEKSGLMLWAASQALGEPSFAVVQAGGGVQATIALGVLEQSWSATADNEEQALADASANALDDLVPRVWLEGFARGLSEKGRAKEPKEEVVTIKG